MKRKFGYIVAWRFGILVLMVFAVVLGIRPLAVPPPEPARANSALNSFSVERALQDLGIITVSPRVPGTPAIDTAREYLYGEFEKLGLQPEITAMPVIRQNAQMDAVQATRSKNLIVRLKGTDSTGAILVAGHLDTAPTSLGASDCGGCAVSVLETARALISDAPLRNDVIFLIEDGEETTRAGSLSFVEQHPWAKDVRVAINMESMGTRGASLLYVTGPENGWLVGEALNAMPSPVAYSFVNDLVWLTGTGGSDLDQFLQAAPVGLGLVYLGNTPAYHTMKDSVRSLDPRTLQHQGENVLSLVRHFGDLPLSGELKAPDLVYYNLAGHWVVRYPAWVGIGLALLAVVGFGLVISIGLRRGKFSLRGILLGSGVFLPLVLLVTVITGLVWFVLRFLDPRLQVYLVGISYDREWYTLAFVLLAIGLVTLGFALFRRSSQIDLGTGALVWWILLAVLTAFLLPGVSHFFTVPALLALIPLAVKVRSVDSHFCHTDFLLLSIAAFGIVLTTAPELNFLGIFSGRGELTTGLPLIALLPALFAGLLAGLLLPISEVITGNRRLLMPMVLGGMALLILVGVAATAGFTSERPKPNMVAYVQEQDQAYWVTLGTDIGGSRAALLDEWTKQFFLQGAQETTFSPAGAYAPDMQFPAYRGPAPYAGFSTMEVQVLSDRVETDGLRHLRLHLLSPMNAPIAVVVVQTEGQMVAAELLGKPLNEIVSEQDPAKQIMFGLHAITGEGLEMNLVIRGEGTVTLNIEEHIYSLPEMPGLTIRPRPDWMLPSPTFVSDATILRHTVTLPAGPVVIRK